MKESLGLHCDGLKLHVLVPVFTKEKQQLHTMEIEHTRGLEPVSIHIETAIGYALKNVQFLVVQYRTLCWSIMVIVLYH